MKTIAVGWWVLSLSLMVLVLIGLGVAIRKHWLGILIDQRNRISLSRFQLILWTTLILSALAAIALQTHQVAIYLPQELWTLMGISTASAAGASIVKGTKGGQQPTPSAAAAAAPAAAPAPATPGAPAAAALPNALGVLYRAQRPKFTDMFKGEELLNADYVDISKVQMFFFTIAAVMGYALALTGYDISGQNVEPALSDELKRAYTSFFPPISAALVTLLGISHAGYLTIKAAPHTPTT